MYATTNYTAAGGANTVYSVAFPVLLPEHLKVSYTDNAGVVTTLVYLTDYTLNSTRTQVTVIPAVTAGYVIKVYRETPSDLANFSVDFASGSVLSADELDLAAKHLLFLKQEATDRLEEESDRVDDQFLKESSHNGPWAARYRRIENVSQGVNPADAITKSQLDALQNAIVPLGTLDALASQGVSIPGDQPTVEVIFSAHGRWSAGCNDRIWNITGANQPRATYNNDIALGDWTYVPPAAQPADITTLEIPFGIRAAGDITVVHRTPAGADTTLVQGVDYSVNASLTRITFLSPGVGAPGTPGWPVPYVPATPGPSYEIKFTRTNNPAYLPLYPKYYYEDIAGMRMTYNVPTANRSFSNAGVEWKNHNIMPTPADDGDPRLWDAGIFIPKGDLGGGSVLDIWVHGMIRHQSDAPAFGGTWPAPGNVIYTQEPRDLYFVLDFNSNVMTKGTAPATTWGSGDAWKISHTMSPTLGVGAYPVTSGEGYIFGTVNWDNACKAAWVNALPAQPFTLHYQIRSTHRPEETGTNPVEQEEAYIMEATLTIPSVSGGVPVVRTWIQNYTGDNGGPWHFYDSTNKDAENGHQGYLGNTVINFRWGVTPHSVWGEDSLARCDVHNVYATITRNRLA